MSVTLHTYNPSSPAAEAFQESYLRLRASEGRMYTDDELRSLPFPETSNRHYSEWKLRAASMLRLTRYLKAKKIRNILEVGAGNGWLSAQMASRIPARVTACDVNSSELQQGLRVFGRYGQIQFAQGDIRSGFLEGRKFQAVVFASSLQYFSSVDEIVEAANGCLADGGEIHILDTPLYETETEKQNAMQRSITYFETAGFPGLIPFYHHHLLKDFQKYDLRIMYDPKVWYNRYRNAGPFYWLKIKAFV